MNNNGIAMTRATIISTVILNFKRNRANRETVFPPEIRSYNFRIYGTLTFYGNANIVMARSYKIAFFFSFFFFFPSLAESEAFVEILLPNWPFHISKNIDSGNVRGEKSFVQSTHRGPASGISNSNFPAIELAGKRAVWSVPSSVETRHKVAAPIMNNSEHKFA